MWLCWVLSACTGELVCVLYVCVDSRLSIGGKRWISWSWWFLDQPVWCSLHPHTVTSPTRTSAAYGTAPPRPCLGKRWISTLTYQRLDSFSDFLFYRVLGLKAPVALGDLNACMFSPVFFPVFSRVWCLLRLCGIFLSFLERKHFFPFLNADISFWPNPLRLAWKLER